MDTELRVVNALSGERGILLSGETKVADLKDIQIEEVVEYSVFGDSRSPVRSWVEVQIGNAAINISNLHLFGYETTREGSFTTSDTNTVPSFNVVTKGHLNGGPIKEAHVSNIILEGFSLTELLSRGKVPLSGEGKEVRFSDIL